MALDGVGNPGLGPGHQIVVAVTPRDGTDGLQVGAGIRLRQAQPAAQANNRSIVPPPAPGRGTVKSKSTPMAGAPMARPAAVQKKAVGAEEEWTEF